MGQIRGLIWSYFLAAMYTLFTKKPQIFYFEKRAYVVISQSEACYLFCFKTLVELRGTHFTSDAEVKDNILQIQLNPLQYLSDFEIEIY